MTRLERERERERDEDTVLAPGWLRCSVQLKDVQHKGEIVSLSSS